MKTPVTICSVALISLPLAIPSISNAISYSQGRFIYHLFKRDTPNLAIQTKVEQDGRGKDRIILKTNGTAIKKTSEFDIETKSQQCRSTPPKLSRFLDLFDNGLLPKWNSSVYDAKTCNKDEENLKNASQFTYSG